MPITETLKIDERVTSLAALKMVPCCLIVTRNNDSEILVQVDAGRHLLLQLQIPRGQRPAPYLIAGLRSRWGIEAICRFGVVDTPCNDTSPTSPLDKAAQQTKPAVFVLDSLGDIPIGLNPAKQVAWVRVDNVDWSDIEPLHNRELCYAALAKARAYATGSLQGAFVRTGWFDGLKTWTQSKIDARGWRLTGNWEQLNMGPDFALIRFETTDAPVWFKAVGAPNLREFSITSHLAELRSAQIPELIGRHPESKGWLMLDGKGVHLDEVWELNTWQRAASSLAALQIESLPHGEALIAAGCHDLRMSSLRCLIEPFLDVVGQLMELQPSSPPRVLNREDLQRIDETLHRACDDLETLAIPCALGNADLNGGNILVDGNRATFIDWAQGNIGQPFIALEYLLVLLLRLRPDLTSWIVPIRESYCNHWKAVCSSIQITRGLELAPLIAIFAYGVTLHGWKDNPRTMPLNLAKLIRSLGRKMLVESDRLHASSATTREGLLTARRDIRTADSSAPLQSSTDPAPAEANLEREGGDSHAI